ncbi:MAG: hypothetical protein AB1742_11180 [bacterium]
MKDDMLKAFVREHFRPLKTRENADIRIGRKTYEWILEKEGRTRLDHLTLERLNEIVAKHALRKVEFEDGAVYIAHPGADRSMMVSYYSEEARRENPMAAMFLKPETKRLPSKRAGGGGVDAEGEGAGEKYAVSESALMEMAREFSNGAGLPAPALLDAISADVVASALERNLVRYHYEDGEVQIIAQNEESGDSPMHTIVFPSPLPGTEVSMQELDSSQRTFLDGAYRDAANVSSHSLEHKITKSGDS